MDRAGRSGGPLLQRRAGRGTGIGRAIAHNNVNNTAQALARLTATSPGGGRAGRRRRAGPGRAPAMGRALQLAIVCQVYTANAGLQHGPGIIIIGLPLLLPLYFLHIRH